MDILALVEKFGFPIGLCLVLLWAIRHQNKMLVAAYTDRIKVLERIVTGLQAKVEELEADRLRRADEYGHTLRDMATRYATTIRDHDALTRSTLAVLRQLTDAITVRPCLLDPREHQPHPARRPATPVPSSADLPDDPAKSPTDRMHTHG